MHEDIIGEDEMADLIIIEHLDDFLHSSLYLGNTRDIKLSWKAKGIFTYIVTLPKDYKLHSSHLLKQATDGKASLYSGLNELIKKGYLHRIIIRNEKNKIVNWKYLLSEQPRTREEVKKHLNNENLEFR